MLQSLFRGIQIFDFMLCGADCWCEQGAQATQLLNLEMIVGVDLSGLSVASVWQEYNRRLNFDDAAFQGNRYRMRSILCAKLR
jgi:hypothetical protein